MISHETKDEIEARAKKVWDEHMMKSMMATLWYRVTIIDECKKRGIRVPDKPGWD